MGKAGALSVVRGRKRRFWRAFEVLLAHQAADPFFAARLAGLAQSVAKARTAVSAPAFLEDGLDQGQEFLVLLAARPLRLVPMTCETAGADLQRLGQFARGKTTFKRGHYLEALERFESETMAKAFFRMSRCRRRYSIS